jgi:hypothetical protein
MTLSPAARQRAMFLILCFVWGTTWLAMKVGIATVPPGVFAARWKARPLVRSLAPRQVAAMTNPYRRGHPGERVDRA